MFGSEYEQVNIMIGAGYMKLIGAEKERMGEGKATVVQIGYPMEGVHFINDGIH